jgi:P pilus assembly chaperone PapD
MKLQNIFFTFLFLTIYSGAFAQSTSISPSRLYFKAAPGETKKQIVHVINSSTTSQSYTVTFGDFDAPGVDGKSQLMVAGQSEHSSSKYMSASPSFFTLSPGKDLDIVVNIDLPNLPEANKVKWGTLMLKIVKERTEAQSGSKTDVGMGLVETFQFVVHIFQTPPSITLKSAEIVSFKELSKDEKKGRTLALISKNTGEAILDCATYLEFSNLQTGNETRNKPSAFTLLPGSSRMMKLAIPKDLPKGKYTVTAVIDFGSKDDVQAAQMDIVIE